MEKESFLFSVVIATYEQNHLLKKSIDSVLKQDYEDIELIICDNGSCDFNEKDIKNYIEKYSKDNIKRVVIQKQEEPVSKAQNYQSALELARGKYIVFLTGELQLAEWDTLTQVNDLFVKESVNLIVTRMRGITPEGNDTDRIFPTNIRIDGIQKTSPAELFELIGTHPYGTYIRMGATFWKKEYLISLGGFSTKYSNFCDWYLWLKICELEHKIESADLITVKYRYDTRANDVDYVRLGLNNDKYQEQIMLLKQVVAPKLKSKTTKMRLNYLIQIISARSVKERNWFYMTLGEKVVWRIRNIKLLLLARLYKIRNGHISIDFYQISRLLAILSICMLLNIPLCGVEDPERIWAILVVIVCVYMSIKICKYFGILLLQKTFECRSNWRKR